MPFKDPVKRQMKFGYTTIETNNMLRDFAGNATGPYRGKMGLIVTHLEDLSMGVSDRLRLNRDAVRAISEAYNPIIDIVRGYKNPNEQNAEINGLRKGSVDHMLAVISDYAARVTPAYAIDKARMRIADNPGSVPGFAPIRGSDPQKYLAHEIETQSAQVSAFKNDVMNRINPVADRLSDYLVANENANRKGKVTWRTTGNIENNRNLFLEGVNKQIHPDLKGNKEGAVERMHQTAEMVFDRAIGALDASLILDMINVMENPRNATPKQKIDAGLEFIRKFANNIHEDVATRPVSRLEQGALIITGNRAELTAPVQSGARVIGAANAGQRTNQLPQHTQPGNVTDAKVIEVREITANSQSRNMQISSAEAAARKKALEDKIKSTMDKNLNRLSEIDKSINPGDRIDNEIAREASILNLLIHIDARLMVAAGIAGREEVSGTADSLASKMRRANIIIQNMAKKGTDIAAKEVQIDFAPSFRNGEDILSALSEWTADRKAGADTAAKTKLSDIFNEYSRMAYSKMSGVVAKLPNSERYMRVIRSHMGDFEKELLGVKEVSGDAAQNKRDRIDIRYLTMWVGLPLELSREKPKSSSDSQLAEAVTPIAKKPTEELRNEEALYMGLGL